MYDVNRLPKRNVAGSPTGCCAVFEPELWDGQQFRFDKKLFMKVTTRSFMHMPLNMTTVMKKAARVINAQGADSGDEYIMLSYDLSPWKSEHLISVSKDVTGQKMTQLSGTYVAKVFEGPFKNVGKWYEQLVDYIRLGGNEPLKTYFSYMTCPACAKVYGKNYVVGFAKIKE